MLVEKIYKMKELKNPSRVEKPMLENPIDDKKHQRTHCNFHHNNSGFERKKGNNLYNRFRRRMRRDLFRM